MPRGHHHHHRGHHSPRGGRRSPHHHGCHSPHGSRSPSPHHHHHHGHHSPRGGRGSPHHHGRHSPHGSRSPSPHRHHSPHGGHSPCGSHQPSCGGAHGSATYITIILAPGRAPVNVSREFVCPLTGTIMTDPVTCGDGYTYEYTAIRHWLDEGHTTSPQTHMPLPTTTLTHDTTLQNRIKEFLGKGDV